MKIKDGFIVREVAGEWMAVATGARTAEFPGIIALSETAAFVWKLLEKESSLEQLAYDLVSEFNVDYEKAKRDVENFLKTLAKEGLLENE
jgi:hypothetical protein